MKLVCQVDQLSRDDEWDRPVVTLHVYVAADTDHKTVSVGTIRVAVSTHAGGMLAADFGREIVFVAEEE